jgi:hypothetical protein
MNCCLSFVLIRNLCSRAKKIDVQDAGSANVTPDKLARMNKVTALRTRSTRTKLRTAPVSHCPDPDHAIGTLVF